MESKITDKDYEEMADAFCLMDVEDTLRKVKSSVLEELYKKRSDKSGEYARGYREALHVVCRILDLDFGLNPYLDDRSGEC